MVLPIEASFATHRTLLWRLCYRMTGSAADADDLVQETFARALEHPPQDAQRDLRPWLVQVALNLSRDHLRWRKRQPYVGPWMPAPIETATFDHNAQPQHPEARFSELESVSMAFLIALEALFHLLTGNADAIERLLSEDVRAWNDGNGEYFAARVPVLGRKKVTTFHLNTRRAAPPLFAVREINGLPALVSEFPAGAPRLAKRIVFTIELDAQGKIRKLDTVVATPKLSHVSFDFSRSDRVSLFSRIRRALQEL